jgi:Gas vesicle synthesis protein GvpL/GvpF
MPALVDTDRGLFLYGVVPVDGTLPSDLTGLDDAPVVRVEHGPVAMVAGWIDLDRPPGRRRDLLAYQGVLDALSATGPVAPVQFGSVVPDEESLVAEVLAPQAEQLARALDDLRGRRQYHVRASYVEDVVLAEVVAQDPEVRALRERTRGLPDEAAYGDRVRLGELVARALAERSAVDADDVLEVVLPFAAAHRVRAEPDARQVLDVALLVDDDRAEALVARLEELAEAVHERLRLRLVGPVAPYDFVGGG